MSATSAISSSGFSWRSACASCGALRDALIRPDLLLRHRRLWLWRLAIGPWHGAWAPLLGWLWARVALAAIAAAVLGYFMIYGRISGVFFGIVTLSLHPGAGLLPRPDGRAGMDDRQGAAERVQRHAGHVAAQYSLVRRPIDLEETALYYVLVVGLVDRRICCCASWRIRGSATCWSPSAKTRSGPNCWATTCGAISSPPSCSAARSAGLSGVLYTSWGQFITPSSIGLPAAAMPIVWVAFSGRSDLTATLVGTFVLLFGSRR